MLDRMRMGRWVCTPPEKKKNLGQIKCPLLSSFFSRFIFIFYFSKSKLMKKMLRGLEVFFFLKKYFLVGGELTP